MSVKKLSSYAPASPVANSPQKKEKTENAVSDNLNKI
jgi:hypothetical protein